MGLECVHRLDWLGHSMYSTRPFRFPQIFPDANRLIASLPPARSCYRRFYAVLSLKARSKASVHQLERLSPSVFAFVVPGLLRCHSEIRALHGLSQGTCFSI